MCGRYVLRGDYPELFEGEFSQTRIPLRFEFMLDSTWNASPSQTLPVLVEEDDAWVVRGMHWGLIPKWTKPGTKPKVMPINARSETAAEKPMFKSLLKYRRCIVPANGFYEWKRIDAKTKQPHYIHLNGEPLMLFAGLYDEAETENGPLQSFTIMTTSANEQMSELHDRMPVILDADDVSDWLSREETETEPLERLLRPLADGALDIYEVDRQVNTPRNNDPTNIDPLPPDTDA
jgi:putative SOS response-associated peptidase YedK